MFGPAEYQVEGEDPVEPASAWDGNRLNLHSLAEEHIKEAVDAGYRVTVPGERVIVGAWCGAVWIQTENPQGQF